MTQVTMKATSDQEAAIFEIVAKRWSGQEISYVAPTASGDIRQKQPASARPTTPSAAPSGQSATVANG